MISRRFAQFLTGEAMAGGEPVGPLLRSLPFSLGAEAALAEAGKIEACLRLLGFTPDLASLGQQWPAALRPAQQRIDRIPDRIVLMGKLLAEFSYFITVAFVEIVVVALLTMKVLPALLDMQAAVGAQAMGFGTMLPRLMVLAVLAGGGLFGLAVLSGGGRLRGWGRHLLRAREAALAAALHDSQAPEAVRSAFARSCKVLQAQGANTRELDMILYESLGSARVALERTTSAVMVAGSAIIVVVPLVTLMSVYLALASLGGAL